MTDHPTEQPTGQPTGHGDQSHEDVPKDPLRRSRVSQAWLSVVGLALLLVLLIVFIAQNTERVSMKFFGWTWHAPLAVVALTGVVVGMVLTVITGTLRIVQVRRRVRREV
ncbi:MAG TPA: lipopolysaccharide assembly protein LapA domain-containing protein [Nocardioides sp.]|jgi:uncharacterized integral membrane protein|uniref:lipopolysaccharide assembly protein LapA domain-containing protein n=1 Tax=Nocardioides sp. TaxID=35761 RepID=UPI002E2FFCDD|nr:lipopolysaccharide assembly protein LapA domain-containing protein [Nocardioides sp.]HEX3929882.1 lipopolysaccharide assembly protein LapA domain-containing protein [Nocardioides sp.]